MPSWCAPGQPVSLDLLQRLLHDAGLQLVAPETPGTVLCSAAVEDAAAMAEIARMLGGLSLVLCITDAGVSWQDPLQARQGTGKGAAALLDVLQAFALHLSTPPGFLGMLPPPGVR